MVMRTVRTTPTAGTSPAAKPVKKTARKPAARKPPPDRTVATAVENLLKTVELDAAGEAKAAIARALAAKLDQAALSDAGPVSLSMAGIAKELREVVDAILESTEDDSAFVHGLFTAVGD